MKKWFGQALSGRRSLLLVLIIVMAWVLVLNTVFSNYTLKKEAYLNAAFQAFSSKVTVSLEAYEKFSEYIFQSAVNQPEILERMSLVRDADDRQRETLRQEVYVILAPVYESITDFDFRQFHIHTWEGDSFLRLHRPERYGDNLMAVRESVRLVNTEFRRVSGFEEGRIYNGYRYVYPLEYQGEHVGSAEVSISMNSLIQNMSALYPELYVNFMIRQEVVDGLIFDEEKGNYLSHPFLEGFYCDGEILAVHPGKNLINDETMALIFERVMEEHPKDLAALDSFTRLVSHGGRDYLVHFLQIRNIKGEALAYLVGIVNNPQDYGIFSHLMSDLVYVSFMFLVLIIGVLIYLNKQNVLERYSTRDHLTNVYNRHKFTELARKVLKNTPGMSSIILLDIDNFKRINDAYGHNFGDEVLKEISARILEHVRSIDMVGRWGGEEFVVLLPNTELAVATRIAERLRSALSEKAADHWPELTASLGVTTLRDYESLHQAIHEADQAMYFSKGNGRNQVTVFEEMKGEDR